MEIFKKSALLIPFLSLALLMGIAISMASTPYRGEHWALLYAFEHSPNFLAKLRNISAFECFANVRFQPLTFFASVLPYWLFGHTFLFQYGLAMALHGLLATLFLRIYSELKTGTRLPLVDLWSRYALEGSIFLLSFIASDVYLWTFYLYLQVALIFLFSAFYQSCCQGKRLERSAVLIGIATLFYEPSVFALPVLMFIRREEMKKRDGFVSALIFLLAIGGVLWRYGEHLESVAKYSINEIPPILARTPFEKAVASILEFGFSGLLLLIHFVWGVHTIRGNIFELGVPEWMRERALVCSLVGLLMWVAVVYTMKRRQMGWVGVLWFFLFIPIAWARTENSNYVVHQFRYGYFVLVPFLWVCLHVLSHFCRRYKLYPMVLVWILAVQAYQTTRHALEVRASLEPVAKQVQLLRQAGADNREIIDRINEAMVTGRGFEGSATPFLTNANSCSLQWMRWLKS